MDDLTHRYCFPEISTTRRSFGVNNYRDADAFEALVAVEDLEYLKSGHPVPPRVADLVDLAVAVSAADRLSICKDDAPNVIEVALPVRDPGLFGNAATSKLLADVLYWYTGDHWRFCFSQHSAFRRGAELQECFPLDDRKSAVEVALWSGGLDALAGLYNRLLLLPETSFTLLGTGSSNIVHRGQKETILAMSQVLAFAGRTRLVRVPIKVTGTISRPKSPELRARGFVFLLLGAACAYLEGQRELNVYENGVGAINLPFRASEVGLDHARSVHPISLLDMSALVTALLGVPFRLHNPFLFTTKAQMCQRLVENGAVELIRKSISCDRLHRQKPMQCGLCSSCLLRRQSLTVLGVEDRADYVATAPHPYEGQTRPFDTTHLQAMIFQADALRSLLSSGNPWGSLSRRYSTLTDTVDRTASWEGLSPTAMQGKLLDLYGRYVREWDLARSAIEVRPAAH